jgi:translocation and assembly module TamB
MLRRTLLATALIASPAFGQEDDRDYLTAFLEDSLSEAGRVVTVIGFEGALSSRATIQSLTIADDTGIWLTVNDVVLDWSRSSLLSGALVVQELSAGEILIERAPNTGEGGIPSPEASGFSLPELPVSVEIGKIAAERIVLGPTVLGQAVEGTLQASMTLADGEGQANVDLIRQDAGGSGEIILDASYSNATSELVVDLRAVEAADGLVVTALGIPGAPAAEAVLVGRGPIDDFAADLQLATDGEERLAGTVTVSAVEDGAYRLRADVAGNLAPMLLPQHVDFFGTDVTLALDATRSATGAVSVDDFLLQARTVRLSGKAQIAADGLPEALSLSGTVVDPAGEPVLLPFGDVPTMVTQADFQLSTTRSDSTSWKATADLLGLDRPDLKIDRVGLEGSGRIGRTGAGNSFGGTLNLIASGLQPTDPALAAALGPTLKGGLKLSHLEGSGVVSFSDIAVTGEEYSAKGGVKIEGLDDDFRTSGRLEVTAADIERFSLLVGHPLGGRATIALEGSFAGLSGEIDANLAVAGEDLSIGVAQLDGVLAGSSRLTASILRDETGTTLRSMNLVAGPLTASAGGKLASDGSDLRGQIDFSDLRVMGPGYGGSVNLAASFTGTPEDGAITLDGTGQSLRIGSTEADRLLAGQSTLSAAMRIKDGAVLVDSAQIANPQLSADLSAEISGATRKLDLSARLANLGLIIPDLQGPLTLDGTATQAAAGGFAVDLDLRGPGQIDARVNGDIAGNFGSADLAISGSGRAGLANLFISPRAVDGTVRYDLALRGPLRLASLSGRMTLADGRITDPGIGIALEGVEAMADISGGRARLAATSRLSTGGQLRLDGPVSLTPPFEADLAVTLQDLRLYNPELFDTRIGGAITISGPLAGGALIAGALTLAETELQVPASGFSTAEALLNIRHRNEPSEVRATRDRAGLLGDSGRGGRGAGGPVYRLDLSISAPNRIFVRGRGIDAELGGEIRLTGTTAAVVPSGAFDLVRGRLDILGKRLVLTRATLALEGSFVPQIMVSASSENDGIISYVTVEGPADTPVVTFSSSPDLPQEEVLSQLLFGRGLETISPLQALQLANAVATLAGRGGLGIVNKLRSGFGLDDLDLTTGADGSTALRAGKYISENVYTELEVGQGGKTRLNLNLDLREGITLKGRVGDDGETGVGIFVERDY